MLRELWRKYCSCWRYLQLADLAKIGKKTTNLQSLTKKVVLICAHSGKAVNSKTVATYGKGTDAPSFFSSFHCSVWRPKQRDNTPPYALPLPRFFSTIPIIAFPNFPLLVVFFWPNGSHLRPRSHPSLYFLMGKILAPKTREWRASRVHPTQSAINGTIAIHGAKSWGHGGISFEIEGNKPLDRRAAVALLVVCCVLSYHTQHTTLLCVVSILLAFPLLIVE